MPKRKNQEQPDELATTSPADHGSDEIVLAYVGPRIAAGVPARDLTAADLARLAYRAAANAGLADGIRPDPRDPDHERAAAIAERLTAKGIYSTDVEAVLAAREAEAAQAERAEAPTAEPTTENPPADPATSQPADPAEG